VILPKRNKVDLDDVPDEIKNSMEFIYVETVDEVLNAALESAPAPVRKKVSSARKKKPSAKKGKLNVRKKSHGR
jgi:ATP-dependent Lon protease